jgi:LPS sulfotransferase NodH
MQPLEGSHELLQKYVPIQYRGLNFSQIGLGKFIQKQFLATATVNGVGGFKVMYSQLDGLARHAASFGSYWDLETENLVSFFPDTRFVWLVRKDTLRQAVSLAKAMQSDAWDYETQLRYAGKYVFDFLHIHKLVRHLRRQNQCWERFFESNNICPLILTYEKLAEDPAATLLRALEFLDLPPPDPQLPENRYFRRQSDYTSDQWVRTFREAEASLAIRIWVILRWLIQGGPRLWIGRVLRLLRLRLLWRNMHVG